MFAARALEDLGYRFVPGPSGQPSDQVLRLKSDPQKGFQWKGQEDYEAVGDAVVAYAQSQLSALCGLAALPLPPSASEAYSAVWATEGLQEQTGPLLLLVCGSPPGGAAGIWGRSLCINQSLEQGAMLSYILRAQRQGWSVVVANPNVNDVSGVPVRGSESPHLHLQMLWRSYIEPAAASCVLVVAHSYGGPAMVSLLKAEMSARARVQALALTDGSCSSGTLLQEEVPPATEEWHPKLREALQSFARLMPTAFAPAEPEVLEFLSSKARNFVSSQLPLGTLVAAEREGVLAVSAGHESHPATTHAATEEVFKFLQKGATGVAAAANAELRQAAAGVVA